ncbi:MAG TPA: hypothetical protein VFA29_15235 [Candidatus Baltobacteraceae bacterium]|nr:hypothetical protein [Candidatus Baltobacteraceae bacterium]
MRPIVSSVSLAACFALATLHALAASHHHTALHSKAIHVRLAPADEYFGRQKMSILEIGNRLRDLAARVRYANSDASDLMNTAAMTEDAMRDWQRKYPGDPWLKRDRSQLALVYKALHR